ncbi:MAG TPA: hypothetical protein VIV54_06385 [Burkholderiales bacterium]
MRLAVFCLIGLALCRAQAEPVEARRTAEQRLAYVEALMRDESAAARMLAHEAARRQQSAAREHLEQGRRLLEQNAPERALREAEQALRALMKARQLAPDPAHQAQVERVRYETQLAGVESLARSLRERPDASAQSAADVDRAARRVLEARTLAEGGRFAQAQLVLAASAALLASALDRLMAGRTLDYTPRFASAEEEYRSELARHRSLQELVPLALRVLQPEADAKGRIDQYMLASAKLRASAERAAGNHDHQTALEALREATSYLQRALTATGVGYPL